MLTGESAGSKGGPCASWRLNSTTALEPPFNGAAHTCKYKRPQACVDAGAKLHEMAVECCMQRILCAPMLGCHRVCCASQGRRRAHLLHAFMVHQVACHSQLILVDGNHLTSLQARQGAGEGGHDSCRMPHIRGGGNHLACLNLPRSWRAWQEGQEGWYKGLMAITSRACKRDRLESEGAT